MITKRLSFEIFFVEFIFDLLGRGLLGQKVAKNVFLWHPSGEHLVYGLFERYA